MRSWYWLEIYNDTMVPFAELGMFVEAKLMNI